MCLCLGSAKSGKTLLMKRLQGDSIDDATQTISTNGVNLFLLKNEQKHSEIIIREIGGNMAPLWKHYLEGVFSSFLFTVNYKYMLTTMSLILIFSKEFEKTLSDQYTILARIVSLLKKRIIIISRFLNEKNII